VPSDAFVPIGATERESLMQRVPLALEMVTMALTGMALQPARSANVRITPLGSHEGKFCRSDRALIFEDPDGTRLLYEAGRTVRGPDDERIGEVDAVLLSHVHDDHLGMRSRAALTRAPARSRTRRSRSRPTPTA
jgi:glyoxylase-like metal-dependent hydrolase (beta-lactamase superfamily II)